LKNKGLFPYRRLMRVRTCINLPLWTPHEKLNQNAVSSAKFKDRRALKNYNNIWHKKVLRMFASNPVS